MSSAHKLFLLDVEGTVAPISLVTEQLFPYARAHFSEFLRNTIGDPAVEADLTLLTEENCKETETGCPIFGAVSSRLRRDPASEPQLMGAPGLASETWESRNPDQTRDHNFILQYLLWLMDHDRKSTALKSLQGKIWKTGFESGELKGTLFADVPEAFARWSAQAKVAIYSSGSVEAQRLLFRHSNYGDLTPLISGYFDTRTGPKAASASYAAIAAAMGALPDDAIFFSDVVRELDAARETGFDTRLVVRAGNAPVDDPHGHIAVESLALI
jgi:enolase-phosphatase E1